MEGAVSPGGSPGKQMTPAIEIFTIDPVDFSSQPKPRPCSADRLFLQAVSQLNLEVLYEYLFEEKNLINLKYNQSKGCYVLEK